MLVCNPSAKRSRRRRSGFTLIEMVVVIWALGVVMLVGTAILVGAFKVREAATTSVNQVSERSMLADQFRTDVAQAAAAPLTFDKWTASPSCLLLRLPEGGHLVYRWQEGRLERILLPKGETRWLLVDPEDTAVEFLRPGAEQGIVTMRLSPAQPRGHAPRVLEIAAALGGDLR